MSDLEIFAATAPGLESIAAGELKTLGIKGRQEIGGVTFRGDLAGIYRANLWLRTASRAIVRLARFHASTFYELERRSKKLRWADFLPAIGSVSIRVTCRKSKLYHSDAVAERVMAAIATRVAGKIDLRTENAAEEEGEGKDEERISGNAGRNSDAGRNAESTEDTQLFIVRIVHDVCEISADSSGQLLHRRGYRQEIGKAPLRETLAAAMLLASGWKRGESVLDPMCGSGTIPIEAALMARGIAPGLTRRFQFMNWPSFDSRLWDQTLEVARDAVNNAGPMQVSRIRGADRDAGAIQAAKRNAERAGVAQDIEFSVQSLSESIAELEDLADGSGWILTNPPYGVRVGDARELRNLYARLGSVGRFRKDWRLGILSADPTLAGQVGMQLRSRFETSNGGIPVSFLVTEKAKVHKNDERIR